MIWLFEFFFFKQKTAYEMRISDWSSDVCSSDLTEKRRKEESEGPAGASFVSLYSPFLSFLLCVLCVFVVQILHGMPRTIGGPSQHEIGRASCRERVCQYV